MQTAINTDVFVRDVINTLVTQMDMWDELKRQKEVEAALYMHLMNKTIIAETEDRQLPAEYRCFFSVYVWKKGQNLP